MKAKALVPALALAAALVAPPLTDAAQRHRSDRGGRPPAHGYYGHRPSHPGYGYGHGGYGYGHYGYRPARPYYRNRGYYAPPPPSYGYGYGYGGYGYGGYGYDGYGYGGYGYYPPPPPPRYHRPRVGVGIWFGF
jgi:hypothetical protein